LLRVSLRNQAESLLLLVMNLAKILLRVRGNRFLHLTPPNFKRQWVLNVPKRKLLSYEIGSWSDWLTAYQIFGMDSYNLDTLGCQGRVEKAYSVMAKSGRPAILDFGGNIGLSSLYFAEEYPEAEVYCVEIDSANIDLAKRNLSSRDSVRVLHAGIASKIGKGFVQDPHLGNDGYRLSANPNGGGEEVDLVEVRTLVDFESRTPILIVKIDIEGSEKELFSENTDWVGYAALIISTPHDWLIPMEANSKNFVSCIGGKDRDFLIKGENIFSMANQVKLPRNKVTNIT